MLWLGNIFLPGGRGRVVSSWHILFSVGSGGDCLETSLEGSSSVAFGCSPLSVAVPCSPSSLGNIPPLLSSPPLCAVLPPASGSQIFPGCCTSIAPYPHAAGAELAWGELRLGFQPCLQEARAHFLGQAAHMASLVPRAQRLLSIAALWCLSSSHLGMFQALQKDPCQPEEFWLNVASWLNMTFFMVQGA